MTAPLPAPFPSRPQVEVSAQPPAEPVLPPPSDDPVAVRVAEILLAAYAIDKTARLIARAVKVLLGITLSIKAIEAASGLARHAHKARPVIGPAGLDPRGPGAALARSVAADDVYFRAAYVVKASQRITAKIEQGVSVKDAVTAEQSFYDAHRKARANRLAVASDVGSKAEMFGPLLGWYRDWASDSDADCILADGNNFYASTIPMIGLPGSVHPRCRCVSGPPHEGAEMVDDVVGAGTQDAPVVTVVHRIAS